MFKIVVFNLMGSGFGILVLTKLYLKTEYEIFYTTTPVDDTINIYFNTKMILLKS